ncbi:MAG: molybdate ABC transporter substrate-binding protein, partial [Bryobacteraceae bacterium]
VDELDREGLLLPGSKAVYARGVLALWIPPSSRARISRIEDVARARVIVIAKPELAPYGEAALESLEKLGLWARVKDQIVYAENINIAREYGASGNADAVFTAYSLVMHRSGTVIRVPEIHKPIEQELGIVAATRHPNEARRFVDFLLTGPGKAMLAESGYWTR